MLLSLSCFFQLVFFTFTAGASSSSDASFPNASSSSALLEDWAEEEDASDHSARLSPLTAAPPASQRQPVLQLRDSSRYLLWDQSSTRPFVAGLAARLRTHMDHAHAAFTDDAAMRASLPNKSDRDGWFARLDAASAGIRCQFRRLLSLAAVLHSPSGLQRQVLGLGLNQFPNIDVELFGSLVTGLGNEHSDADVSVRFASSGVEADLVKRGEDHRRARENQNPPKILSDQGVLVLVLTERLQMLLDAAGESSHVRLTPIPEAQVPIIQVGIFKWEGSWDQENEEEMEFRFDISINNAAAVRNSQWLRAQVYDNQHFHRYFRPLMVRVKEFARSKNLDKTCYMRTRPSRRGLSSYGWALLVSFYLRNLSFEVEDPISEDYLDNVVFRNFKVFYWNFNWGQNVVSFPDPDGAFLHGPLERGVAIEKKSAASHDAVVLCDPFVENRNLLDNFLKNFVSGGGRGGRVWQRGWTNSDIIKNWRDVFAPDSTTWPQHSSSSSNHAQLHPDVDYSSTFNAHAVPFVPSTSQPGVVPDSVPWGSFAWGPGVVASYACYADPSVGANPEHPVAKRKSKKAKAKAKASVAPRQEVLTSSSAGASSPDHPRSSVDGSPVPGWVVVLVPVLVDAEPKPSLVEVTPVGTSVTSSASSSSGGISISPGFGSGRYSFGADNDDISWTTRWRIPFLELLGNKNPVPVPDNELEAPRWPVGKKTRLKRRFLAREAYVRSGKKFSGLNLRVLGER